ncbi:hypothetical protein BST81_16770 [Leptolyngbya sp. 'hensonii']|nr:hypothetical protein BST81_16770 [Leptolyngbya sp. 'hensonii']
MCPYCGAVAIVDDGNKVYQTTAHGPMWICANYPDCDAYVGAHPDGKPLGTLANAELRRLRQQVHKAFNPIWKDGALSRGEAYGWLAAAMGLNRQTAHIGQFDVEQCKQALEICQEKNANP